MFLISLSGIYAQDTTQNVGRDASPQALAKVYKEAIEYIRADHPSEIICFSDSTYTGWWAFLEGRNERLTSDAVMEIYLKELIKEPLFDTILHDLLTKDPCHPDATRIIQFSSPFKNMICGDLPPIPTWAVGMRSGQHPNGLQDISLYLFVFDENGNILQIERSEYHVD